MPIDRRAVVARHDVRLTAPDPGVVFGLGNGDLGVNADVTDLQTSTAYRRPLAHMATSSVFS